MLQFEPFAAVVKVSITFDSNSTREGLPTRQDDYPARNKSVRRWEAWTSVKVSCTFLLFVVSNRHRLYLLRIVRSSVPFTGQAPHGTLCSGLCWALLSAQLRRERSCSLSQPPTSTGLSHPAANTVESLPRTAGESVFSFACDPNPFPTTLSSQKCKHHRMWE